MAKKPKEKSLARSLGERITEIRTELGLSIEEVAEKAKVSVDTLRGIENRKFNAKFRFIWDIAIALDVRPIDLLA